MMGWRPALHPPKRSACLHLLDVTGDAGDGAAGTNARDENVHLAFGIVPDLGPGGAKMDLRVGRIFELLQQHVVIRLERWISSASRSRPACRASLPSGRLWRRRQPAPCGAPIDMVSGIVSVMGYPLAAATKASAMPVLPLVGSINSLPAVSTPRFSGIPYHGGADAAFYGVGRIAAFDFGITVAPPPFTNRFN